MRRTVPLLLGLACLTGCPHDFSRDLGSEAGVVELRIDLPSPDRAGDRRAPDLLPAPDLGCPSPCVTTFAGVCRAAGTFLDGPLATAAFNKPVALALEPDGGILVADATVTAQNGRVRRIAGGLVTSIAGVSPGTLMEPYGVAADGQGGIIIVDHDRHLVHSLEGGTLSRLAGDGPGYLDGPALLARFRFPCGAAVHPTLGLLVVDTNNHVIRRIAEGKVETWAGSQPGNSNGPPGELRLAEFAWPEDIVLDSDGTIYFSDTGNGRVRRVAGGILSTLAGAGPGYLDGPANQALLVPAGLAVDGKGAVLVADRFNNRIRRIAGGQVTTLAGSGNTGMRNGPAATAEFSSPNAVLVQPDGVVLVADSMNNCIRQIR